MRARGLATTGASSGPATATASPERPRTATGSASRWERPDAASPSGLQELLHLGEGLLGQGDVGGRERVEDERAAEIGREQAAGLRLRRVAHPVRVCAERLVVVLPGNEQ